MNFECASFTFHHQEIAPFHFGTFNVTVEVVKNTPIERYNLSRTLAFDNSVQLSLSVFVTISPDFLNSSLTTYKSGLFTTQISEISQSSVAKKENGTNLALTSGKVTTGVSSGNLTIYDGRIVEQNNYAASVILNKTSGSINYVIRKTSLVLTDYNATTNAMISPT